MGAEHLNDNIETLASLRARAEQGISRHQWRIEQVTAQVGRPRSFYLVLTFVGAWVALNVALLRMGSGRAFDPPPFPWLQGVISLAALLMTTTILITQNRQTAHAEQRSQLELQINLLAEQKVAKLIALMEELRRDLPSVRDRVDDVAEEMKEPVDPHAVLSALESTMDSHSEPDSSSSVAPHE